MIDRNVALQRIRCFDERCWHAWGMRASQWSWAFECEAECGGPLIAIFVQYFALAKQSI